MFSATRLCQDNRQLELSTNSPTHKPSYCNEPTHHHYAIIPPQTVMPNFRECGGAMVHYLNATVSNKFHSQNMGWPSNEGILWLQPKKKKKKKYCFRSFWILWVWLLSLLSLVGNNFFWFNVFHLFSFVSFLLNLFSYC